MNLSLCTLRSRPLAPAALLLAASMATAEVQADSLTIDWPGSILSMAGSDLLIVGHGVSMHVDSYAIEETDVIRRSGFDADYWTWELAFAGGGLGEGEGSCVMKADAHDARLTCDGR